VLNKKIISLETALIALICCSNFQAFAQDAEVTAMTEPTLATRYPTKAIIRPGIMPTGIFAVDMNAKLTNLKTVGLDIGTEFGLVKKLQGSLSYDGLKFNDFDIESTVNLGAKYNYFGIRHLSFSGSLNVPIHITGEIVRDFTLGLPIVAYNDKMAGSIFGDVLKLTMRPNIESEINLKAWYGYQVYGDFWAMAKTSFGQFKMTNDKNQAKWDSNGFWQKLPAEIYMIYALNHYFDINANFGFDDVMKAKETLYIGVGIVVRGGEIFG